MGQAISNSIDDLFHHGSLPNLTVSTIATVVQRHHQLVKDEGFEEKIKTCYFFNCIRLSAYLIPLKY